MTPSAPVCAVHPASLAVGACPRCGAFVCAACTTPDTGLQCTACRAREDADLRAPTPWERRDELGWVQAWWQTTVAATTRPTAFFKSVRPDGAPLPALGYGWVNTVLATPFNALVLWFAAGQLSALLAAFAQGGRMEEAIDWARKADEHRAAFVAGMLTSRLLFGPLLQAFSAGLVHLGVKLWSAGAGSFTATLRAVCYVTGAWTLPMAMVGLVPGVNSLIGFVVLGYEVVALAHVRRSSVGRAVGAVLTVPLVLACCAVGGVLVVTMSLLAGRLPS